MQTEQWWWGEHRFAYISDWYRAKEMSEEVNRTWPHHLICLSSALVRRKYRHWWTLEYAETFCSDIFGASDAWKTASVEHKIVTIIPVIACYSLVLSMILSCSYCEIYSPPNMYISLCSFHSLTLQLLSASGESTWWSHLLLPNLPFQRYILPLIKTSINPVHSLNYYLYI